MWLPGSKCERGGSARRGGRVVARPVCGVLAESRAEFDVGACVGRRDREDLFALHCAGQDSAHTRSRKRQ